MPRSSSACRPTSRSPRGPMARHEAARPLRTSAEPPRRRDVRRAAGPSRVGAGSPPRSRRTTAPRSRSCRRPDDSITSSGGRGPAARRVGRREPGQGAAQVALPDMRPGRRPSGRPPRSRQDPDAGRRRRSARPRSPTYHPVRCPAESVLLITPTGRHGVRQRLLRTDANCGPGYARGRSVTNRCRTDRPGRPLGSRYHSFSPMY